MNDRKTSSHGEQYAEATVKVLRAVAGPAYIAETSSHFEPAEAEELKTHAQTLWSNGHWLHMTFQKGDGESTAVAPTFAQLDEALAAVIKASFLIGAASMVHPANKRHLDFAEMEDLRDRRAQSPKQVKRERIRNAVLPPLLARGASRTDQLRELVKALEAENAGTISPAGADRWRRKVLAMMAAAKTSD